MGEQLDVQLAGYVIFNTGRGCFRFFFLRLIMILYCYQGMARTTLMAVMIDVALPMLKVMLDYIFETTLDCIFD